MKIAYIAGARIPTEKAHGYQICRMCAAFARVGADVKLLAPERRNDIKADPFAYYGLERNFAVKKLKAIDFVGSRKVYGKITYYLQLLDFLGRLFFLKIEENTLVYTRTPEAAWVMKMKGWPVAYECHSWPRHGELFKYLVKDADLILTTTASLQQKFLDQGFSGRQIHVAPDAADLAIFDIKLGKDQARQKTDLPLDKMVIGYTGNFTTMGKEKGIGLILEAVCLIKEKKPDIMFVAVGGKDEEIQHFIAEAGMKGISDNVILRPRVNLDTLAVYQQACDILLMPYPDIEHYRYYMSPLKMFEYMASQRPIIASDLPSVREILNDANAFFVPPDSAPALADKILAISADPPAAEQKAAQAHQDAQAYTWEKRAEKILALIPKLSSLAGSNQMIAQLFKYGLAAAINYLFIMGGTFFLVEIMKINVSLAYFAIITAAYIYNYLACSKFVFKAKMEKRTLVRFLIYLAVFWSINNLIFNYLVIWYHIPYLAAIIFNIVVLGLVRFFVQRKYVFA